MPLHRFLGFRLLLAVAGIETIALAAPALGFDATTAARRSKRLETNFGQTLFERSRADIPASSLVGRTTTGVLLERSGRAPVVLQKSGCAADPQGEPAI